MKIRTACQQQDGCLHETKADSWVPNKKVVGWPDLWTVLSFLDRDHSLLKIRDSTLKCTALLVATTWLHSSGRLKTGLAWFSRNSHRDLPSRLL